MNTNFSHDLSSKAMLAGLSISVWSAHKYDAKISREVAEKRGANESVGRYRKRLGPDEPLKKLRSIASEARDYYYSVTLAWANDGRRILSATAPRGRRGKGKKEQSMTPHSEYQFKRLQRARTHLMLNSPFMSSVVLRLILAERDEAWFLANGAPCATAATDGKHLFWCAKYIATLDDLELTGLIAHEVGHCLMGHMARRGDRQPLKWNRSADFTLNLCLVDAKYTLPKGALLDQKYAGMYAEQVYNLLPDPPQSKKGGGSGQGKGQGDSDSWDFGGVLDPTDDDGQPLTTEQKQQLEQEWKIAASQAQSNAKRVGCQPGSLEKMVAESLRAKVDWREVLQRFIQTSTEPRDYQWTPLNRRYLALGLGLPSIRREGIGAIDVHVDCSGSTWQGLLDQWAAELNAIAGEAHPERIRVIYWDTIVQGVEEFSCDEEITFKMRGGGGTDLRASFEWVEQSGIEPVCSIVLTDMYIGGYPPEPSYPVLFATPTRDVQAPFGETVLIEDN